MQNVPPTSTTNVNVEHLNNIREEEDKELYMREITEKRSYTRYTNENKAKFFKLKIDKYMSTLAAAKQLCIHVCAAQRWVK